MECGLRAVQWVFERLCLQDITESEMDALARMVRTKEVALRYDAQHGGVGEAGSQFNERPGPAKGFYNVDVLLAAVHSRTGPFGAGYLVEGDLTERESPHAAYIIGGGGHWRCLLVCPTDMTRGEVWDTDAEVMSVVCLPYLTAGLARGSTLIWVNPKAAGHHQQRQQRLQELARLPDQKLTELLSQMQGSERTDLWCSLPGERQASLLPLQSGCLQRILCEAMGLPYPPAGDEPQADVPSSCPPSPGRAATVASSSSPAVRSRSPSSLELLVGLAEEPVVVAALSQTHSSGVSQVNCVVCMDRSASHAARPCGHIFCKLCLRRLTASGSAASKCPCCRGCIQSYERADGSPSQAVTPMCTLDASPSSFSSVDFELQRIREADLPATGDPAARIQRMYQDVLAEEEAIRAEDALAADLREIRAAVLPTTGNPQDILDRWAMELGDEVDVGVDSPIAMRTRSRAPTGTSLTALPQRARLRRVDASVDEESVAPSPSLFSDSLSSQQ